MFVRVLAEGGRGTHFLDGYGVHTIPSRAGAQAGDVQGHCVRGRHESKRQLAFALTEQKNKFMRFWQRRFYDFNVYSHGKKTEKLNYMHANPVVRGLAKMSEGLALEQREFL